MTDKRTDRPTPDEIEDKYRIEGLERGLERLRAEDLALAVATAAVVLLLVIAVI